MAPIACGAALNRPNSETKSTVKALFDAASNEEVSMPMETSWRGGKSVQDWINLVCGVLLFISPWALGFSHDMMAARTAWVGGIVIAAMGIAALVQFAEWEDWVALIAGVLMIISPWVLGFAAMHFAAWTMVVLGLVVALASVSEIWIVHNQTAVRS
jgi:uncharacterized membrane protein HdeD (DUF308 family)